MSEGKRAYRSPLRAEQARRTRDAVLTAAGTCFLRDGYARTTMKAIAAEAGVGVQTVFSQGSKPALLLAVVDRTIVDGGAEDATEGALAEQEPFRAAVEAEGKAATLDALRALFRTRSPAYGPIMRVFRAAAATDPELAEAWARYEGLRHTDVRRLVAGLAGHLRPDIGVDRATEILAYLVGMDAGETLLAEYGWTLEEQADWFVDALDRLLLR